MLIPNEAWPYQELSIMYKKIGDTSFSIQLLYKANLILEENKIIQDQINHLALRQGYMYASAQEKLINEPKNQIAIQQLEKPQMILYTNSIIMRDMGYYHYAIHEINQCLKNNPKEILAMLFKAKLLILFGRFEECKSLQLGAQVVYQAYQLDKSHPKVTKLIQFFLPRSDEFHQQAKQLILKQEFQNSLYFIEKGLLFNPQSLQLMLLKAFINRTQKNYEQSLVDLEQAYKLCSSQDELQNVRLQISHTYNDMAKLLFSLNRAQEALQIFQEAINFNINDWGIHVNLADCLTQLKDYQKAKDVTVFIQNYLIAKEQPDCDQEAVNNRLSILLCLQGVEQFNKQKYDQAIKFFTEAVVLDGKKNSKAYSKRGICFLKKGKVAEAQSDFRIALQIDPKNQDSLDYFNNTNFKAK